MDISFDNVLNIILNTLNNALCVTDTLIEKIEIKYDIDEVYNLFIHILDKEYKGMKFKFNILLNSLKNQYEIQSIYLITETKTNQLTPYYYEGLNELYTSLNNVLQGMYFFKNEVRQYEK